MSSHILLHDKETDSKSIGQQGNGMRPDDREARDKPL